MGQTGPPQLPYGISAATVRGLSGYGVRGLHGYRGLTFGEGKLFFVCFLKLKKNCQKTSSYFLMTDLPTNFHFQPLNHFITGKYCAPFLPSADRRVGRGQYRVGRK